MKRSQTVTGVFVVVTIGGLTFPAARAAAAAAAETAVAERLRDDGGQAEVWLGGSGANLVIRDGVLVGRVAENERGLYHATITSDRAKGRGPAGPIDVRIKKGAKGYEVVGVWNGDDLDFIFDTDGIRGDAVRPKSTGGPGNETCRYDIHKVSGRASYAGTQRCIGLDKLVRFEVQPKERAALSDEENIILLLTYVTDPSTTAAL